MATEPHSTSFDPFADTHTVETISESNLPSIVERHSIVVAQVAIEDSVDTGDADEGILAEQPPMTRFQIDCSDALTYVDAALQQVGKKEVAASVLGNVYLQVADAVSTLSARLRNATMQADVDAAVKQAKVQVFQNWIDGMTDAVVVSDAFLIVLREHFKDIAPEASRAMAELEKVCCCC